MQVHIRYFHCPVCHKVMVAPKHKNFKKEKNIEKICGVLSAKKKGVLSWMKSLKLITN